MAAVTLQAIKLNSNYLEEVATKRAQVDAKVKDVALSCIESLVHFLFNYLFYLFYPSYEQFYHEQKVVAFTAQGMDLPAYEASRFREAVLFIHRFIASPSTIGSIFPSSNGLIRKITRKISQENTTDRRILEIGAGTGPFTVEIIKNMKAGDHLDVVEYDADLARLLVRKFRHLDNVTIHQIDITKFVPREKYDVVVSGLPLNAFQSSFVKEILKKYVEVTKPGGSLSYFEYIGLGTLKKAFLCGESYSDFSRILSDKREFVETFGSETDEIYLNMTPARIRHCVIEDSKAQAYLTASPQVVVAAS